MTLRQTALRLLAGTALVVPFATGAAAQSCDQAIANLEQRAQSAGLQGQQQREVEQLLESARLFQRIEREDSCQTVVSEAEQVLAQSGGKTHSAEADASGQQSSGSAGQQAQTAEGGQAGDQQQAQTAEGGQAGDQQQPQTAQQAGADQRPAQQDRVTEQQIQVGNMAPTIIVRQPPPRITVEIPEPRITVDMPEPEIIVQMPDPNVQVEQGGRPQVQVQMEDPEVEVRQGQAEMTIQRSGQVSAGQTRQLTGSASGSQDAAAQQQGSGQQAQSDQQQGSGQQAHSDQQQGSGQQAQSGQQQGSGEQTQASQQGGGAPSSATEQAAAGERDVATSEQETGEADMSGDQDVQSAEQGGGEQEQEATSARLSESQGEATAQAGGATGERQTGGGASGSTGGDQARQSVSQSQTGEAGMAGDEDIKSARQGGGEQAQEQSANLVTDDQNAATVAGGVTGEGQTGGAVAQTEPGQNRQGVTGGGLRTDDARGAGTQADESFNPTSDGDQAEPAEGGRQMAALPADGGTADQLGGRNPDDMVGQEVENTRGSTVGEIVDLVKQKSDGQIFVVLSVGGFLGLGDKEVAVALAAFEVDDGETMVIPDTTEESLEALPPYNHAMYVSLSE